MNRYLRFTLICTVLALSHTSYAHADNGNLFEKTWAAPNDLYTGFWGELGVYAEEGLDIDQDGNREFIIYDHVIGFVRYDHLQVWEANGDNQFELAWQVRYDDWQSQTEQGHGLTVADLDFDGRQEILVATESYLYIYEWDGTTFESGGGLPAEPTLTLETILDNAGRSNIRQLRVAELDGDPELEIFMGYTFTDGIYCVIGSLPGSDLSNPEWKLEYIDDFPPYYVGGVNINDFDGDGNMEIFTCHIQDESVFKIYESDGADTYVEKFTAVSGTLNIQPLFDDAIADPVFYDFDKDGKKEFLIADIHGKVFIITHDASNGFTDFGSSAWSFLMYLPDVQANGFVRSGVLADLDQDGKPDIYYNDMTAKAVLDLEYQGGPVTDPNSWIAYKIYTGHPLIIGYIHPAWDLDGDGKQELVIAASGQPTENLQVIESLDVTSIHAANTILPEQFTLYQNYPNPFNPETVIAFELEKPAQVRLEVYSLLGEKTADILNALMGAGSHEIKFNGRYLPSGVYFYRITADNIIQQKKMLLLK